MELPFTSWRKRQVNLLPRDAFEHSLWGVVLSWALTFGKWSVIVTQLIVTGVFLTRFGYDRQLTDINKNIAKQVAIIKGYEETERDFTLTQKRITKAKSLVAQNQVLVDVLTKLENKTPSDIWYERLTITPTTTTIVADAGSLAGLSQFITTLSTDKDFDSVMINNLQDGAKKGARFQFDVVLSYGKAKK